MSIYIDIHNNLDEASLQSLDKPSRVLYDVRFIDWRYFRSARTLFCIIDAPSIEAAIKAHSEIHGLIPNDMVDPRQRNDYIYDHKDTFREAIEHLQLSDAQRFEIVRNRTESLHYILTDCPSCNYTGKSPCPVCLNQNRYGGSAVKPNGRGGWVLCSTCEGWGYDKNTPCQFCHGAGKLPPKWAESIPNQPAPKQRAY